MPPDSAPTATGLTFRQWRDEDIVDLVEVHRDPAMRRWTTPVATHDDAVAWVATQQAGWHTGHRLSFAVVDADRLVGCVVLKHRREIGYWTASSARGRGVASRAVDALSAWAFAALDVAELELRHQVDNEASCRVAHKTGYRYVSTLPAEPPFPLDGHLHVRVASVVMAVDQST